MKNDNLIRIVSRDIKSVDTPKEMSKNINSASIKLNDELNETSEKSGDEKSSPQNFAVQKSIDNAKITVDVSGVIANKGRKLAIEKVKNSIKSNREKSQMAKDIKHASTDSSTSIKNAIMTNKVNNQSQNFERSVKSASNIYTANSNSHALSMHKASQNYKRTKQVASVLKNAPKSLKASAQVLAKSLKAAIQAIISAARSLYLMIVAGGSTALIVIILILFIAIIASSAFGIFFSNDYDDSKLTSVITSLNKEFNAEIEKLKANNPHDEFKLTASDNVPSINWIEVLAVFAVKYAADKDNPNPVAIIDDTNTSFLRNVLFEMNVLSSTITTESVEETKETINDNGETVLITEVRTKSILAVNIEKKTPLMMADSYGFSKKQRDLLDELLSEEYNSLWEELIGGFTPGSGQVLNPDGSRTPTGIFGWPLEIPGVITSYFGGRRDPITGASSNHSGTDIAAPMGTPILSGADGQVTIANSTDSYGGGWGYYVRVRHDSTYETLYAHCSSLAVSVGECVKKGQVIAYIGSTGRSTGPHLHWEVYQNGVRTDALAYFK